MFDRQPSECSPATALSWRSGKELQLTRPPPLAVRTCDLARETKVERIRKPRLPTTDSIPFKSSSYPEPNQISSHLFLDQL
jgi:hypothetical protein